MIDLQQLTKQKFERLGWSYQEKDMGLGVGLMDFYACQLKIPADFGSQLFEKAAQLITLDSEIEKLEAESNILAMLDDTNRDYIEKFNSPIVQEWHKELGQQITELKKMREELQ